MSCVEFKKIISPGLLHFQELLYQLMFGTANMAPKHQPFVIENKKFLFSLPWASHNKFFVNLRHRFPYYQGESIIFYTGNFLYQTPDTKNL